MTHTSTPRKRKTVKKRRLSVELWLQGQQLHRMQGAEPQRQDACREGGDGTLLSASSPFSRPSTRHPPGAHCLLPGQYLQTYAEPSHATLWKDSYSPDVIPFNFQAQGKRQSRQRLEEAGSPKDTQPASNRTQIQTGLYPQGLLWLRRETAEVTLFLISDEAEWKKKSRRPSLSLVSHVTLYSSFTLS